jgi:hypothetical protein
VVILSPHVLAKGWPRRVLNGLMAIEEDGRKVILPIWHEIDRAALVSYSPILADRLAATTPSGLPAVATDTARVVLEDHDSPSVASPTLARRLADLLDANPTRGRSRPSCGPMRGWSHGPSAPAPTHGSRRT